jgi:hypothetical protein
MNKKDSSGHLVPTMSVRLTAELKEWLKSYSIDHQISANAVIKVALEQFRNNLTQTSQKQQGN